MEIKDIADVMLITSVEGNDGEAMEGGKDCFDNNTLQSTKGNERREKSRPYQSPKGEREGERYFES